MIQETLPKYYREFQIYFDTDVIFASRESCSSAMRWGFSKEEGDRIALCVAELGTNIVKYAGEGTIRCRIDRRTPSLFRVEALDKGKGIRDISRALQDGSTDTGPLFESGRVIRPLHEGLGCGLGAIKRVMDTMVIESSHENGTHIVACIKHREIENRRVS